jgi:hypothetical protein
MYGPITGILASSVQLAGYDDIISPNSDIYGTDIKIIKWPSSQSYDDYISHYQSDVGTDYTDKLYYFQLVLAL